MYHLRTWNDFPPKNSVCVPLLSNTPARSLFWFIFIECGRCGAQLFSKVWKAADKAALLSFSQHFYTCWLLNLVFQHMTRLRKCSCCWSKGKLLFLQRTTF